MYQTLENQRLCIKVAEHGAELCSIYDKKNSREILWQADPSYWKRHAPVLFPNVGRHYQDHYRTGANTYPSKQHGFARDMDFSCLSHTLDSVLHELCSSPETKETYPYDFTLQIRHTLQENSVMVSWIVKNTGSTPMYFTIGGHPAFCVPVLPNTEFSDYYLGFQQQDSLTYFLIDPASGTAVPQEPHTLALSNGCVKLDSHMFDRDALILDNGQITTASILLPDQTPYLTMHCEGFPNFGIWSVPGAPYVCLEPWMGRCDDRGYEGTLEEKPQINALKPGEIFHKDYSIEIF